MKPNNLLSFEPEAYLHFNLYEPCTAILTCPFSNRLWKQSEILVVYNHPWSIFAVARRNRKLILKSFWNITWQWQENFDCLSQANYLLVFSSWNTDKSGSISALYAKCIYILKPNLLLHRKTLTAKEKYQLLKKNKIKENYTVYKLTSTWSQRPCFSQISAISSRGSNAPSTVVPAVAQTRNGADPCNRIQNKKLSFALLISSSIFGELKYNKVLESRTEMWQSTF